MGCFSHAVWLERDCKMGIWSSLNREQKVSVALLQTGTFLEYFDLMLYIHMAVLLNELFFPKYDPYTTSIVAAGTLCSTYVMRPIGALIFGWIGDCYGRKKTIIITTTMMAISCIVMANLPTYSEIGITAAVLMILCRMAQGMSSMGEAIGAEIYLTESVSRPARFPVVAFIDAAGTMGGFAALGVATFILSYSMNWRFIFWGGAIIAVITAFARTRLRETPEFLEMKKKQMKKEIEELNLEFDPVRGAELNKTWKEPVNNKTLLSYFSISCGYPLCFYLAFIYFNPILKENFGYSPEDIIRHNLLLSSISVVASIFLSFLSYYVFPLKINKIRGRLALCLMISIPFFTMNLTSPLQLFLIQTFILLLSLEDMPSVGILLDHFPVYRRVTLASFLFAGARALMAIVTTFGLVWIASYFPHFGVWLIALPLTIVYLFSINHFERLEHKLEMLHKRLGNKSSS
jgi:MHS family proline/betaine transporter-like MFS transporter